jgi:DNA-binding beta-propeller fold protein YncE
VLDVSATLSAPRGLAVDARGTVYVADTGHNRVAVIDESGKLVRSWGTKGTRPGEFATVEDVAVGADGRIYVLDSGVPRVQVFAANGTRATTFDGGRAWCSPAGLGLGKDSHVYVADTCGGRIRKYSPAGDAEAAFAAGQDPATRLDQPVDVAVGNDGTLYVADLRQRVVKIDPVTDTIVKSWPVHVTGALGGANLTIAGATLYLANADRTAPTVIHTASEEVDESGGGLSLAPPGSPPIAIAIGPGQSLLVLEPGPARIQIADRRTAAAAR